MSSAASVKIAFAAQIFSCKHGLPSVSGDVEAAARALADPPGMHKRKLTDAEKAEQDTKEAEQREHLQSIIRKALSFSDDAARLAKEAEANAERAQSAATSGNADSLVIRDVLAEDHALTATVMKLAQEGDAFAASAGSHFEACAAAAEAIRTKYEQATVCMTASDAEACLASCEIEFDKASKEATATSDDRQSADDVARRIALARAEARLRVAQSLCDRSRDRTQGYVATAQALDQTVDAVRSATSSTILPLSPTEICFSRIRKIAYCYHFRPWPQSRVAAAWSQTPHFVQPNFQFPCQLKCSSGPHFWDDQHLRLPRQLRFRAILRMLEPVHKAKFSSGLGKNK
jgi:hypothetical protein